MGICFDKPIVRVGNHVFRKSHMKKLKTYHDVLRELGHECPSNTSITVIINKQISFVYAYSQFQFVDEIIFKGMHIPVQRLYGRKKTNSTA
jgi:hypothetical protein